MCNCKRHARQFCWHLKKFGQCRYGRNCRYRHGKVNHECPYFKANQCVFGVRCWLKHSLPKPATVADFVEAEVNKVSAEKEKKRASLSDSKVKKGTPEHLMKPAFKGIQQILDDNAKLKDENHRLGQQVTSLKKQVERVTKPLRKRMKENEMKVSEESIDEFFDERAQAIDKIKGLEETVTLLGDELEKKNEIINNKNDLIVSLTDEKKAWVSEQNTIRYLKSHIQKLEQKLETKKSQFPDEAMVNHLRQVDEERERKREREIAKKSEAVADYLILSSCRSLEDFDF
mmetsp:Transcript_22542/g.28369  ORF Transcript_22542/g.28369 Transcript_22542/m.28369 type:complete len:287 (+) Transcript_22542:200-1060(+)